MWNLSGKRHSLLEQELIASDQRDLEDALGWSVSDGDSGGVCPARRSGPSVRLNVHATASESTGIIWSRVCDMSESSLPNSDNSSMGVACVDLASTAVASLAPVCSSPRSTCCLCCWCSARASHCVTHACCIYT